MSMQLFKKCERGVILLGLVCCMVACNKNSPNAPQQQQPPAVVQPTLSSIQANIFSLKCAVAGCHVTGGIAPMSLQSGSSFASLVNANSAYGTPLLQRVTPNDALNSVLYLKIIGAAQTGGNQARMPLGIGPMSTAEIMAVQTWINNGALNN